MAGRLTSQWMACVLVLAVCGWHRAMAAELPFAEAGAEEDLPDMSRVKALAESGRARSQTQLADFYLATGDFTNAVLWYRLAADQGQVPAQLSLAGCLISGRGTVKNPSEAARVLRLAADTIESSSATGRVEQAAGAFPATSASQMGNAPGRLTNPPPVSAATARSQPANALTNLPRVRRVETLLAVEPALDSAQPKPPPPPAPR